MGRIQRIVSFLGLVGLVFGVFAASNARALSLCAEFEGAYLYSQEATPVYLGFFGTASAHDSVMNTTTGPYGSSSSPGSVRCTYGKYGSSEAWYQYSSKNDSALHPPIIYKKDGSFLGYLSTNETLPEWFALNNIDSASCPFTSTLSPPEGVTASDGAYTDKIHVSWQPVYGANTYTVYSSDSETGFQNEVGTSHVYSLDITKISPNTVSYFRVRATNTAFVPEREGALSLPDAGSPKSTRMLSVTMSGKGLITSSPSGISCGSDCTERYAQGTVITLHAAPADDINFHGWSGACEGVGDCVVTLDADKSVNANFSMVLSPVYLLLKE